jgi:predicted ATP-grasp superfamily ATP-dependent carboligase
MNVLIFEYITGGGLVGEVLPASLVKEGELMLNAVANDFKELPDVQVSVLRDSRLQSGSFDNEYIVSLEKSFAEIISSEEKTIDALLIIAPESGGVLSSLCESYSDDDFILLNSSASSTALVSDKLETYNFLLKYNIPQIPSYELNDLKSIHSDEMVVKPKDGVGCENIKLVTSSANIANAIDLAKANKYIAQPYVEGKNASLSLLCWQGECLLLSANIQTIEINKNNFELTQCIVNALEREKYIEFSDNLIKTMPGLRGYIGADILITENEVLLVEVNPRLTTSYVGLKSALGINPANLILQTFTDKKLPQVDLIRDNSVIVEIGEECAA